MENVTKNITKICSFYVSDWHLTTMLLPYINKEIDDKNEISTILENDLENNITVLVERMKMENKSKILQINWKNEKNLEIENIENILKNKREQTIVINGKKEYIENANKAIEKLVNLNNKNLNNLKILNCYEVMEVSSNFNEILDKHDKVLNTTGEKNIEEVFEGYKRMNIV